MEALTRTDIKGCLTFLMLGLEEKELEMGKMENQVDHSKRAHWKF